MGGQRDHHYLRSPEVQDHDPGAVGGRCRGMAPVGSLSARPWPSSTARTGSSAHARCWSSLLKGVHDGGSEDRRRPSGVRPDGSGGLPGGGRRPATRCGRRRCGDPSTGKVLAGPARHSETILFADIDLAAVRSARRHFDPVGHYHRPDIFQLHVDTRPRPAVVVRRFRERTGNHRAHLRSRWQPQS
jgi:hypothetical protein